MRRFFILLFAVLIPALFAASYIGKFLYLDKVECDSNIIIEQGQNISEIASHLHEKRAITNEYLFKVIAQLYTMRGRYIQAGEYFFPDDAPMKEVLEMMLEGIIVERKITIVEGSTVYEVISDINVLDTLGGNPVALNAFSEGSFLPNTYRYSYKNTKESLLKRVSKNMQSTLEDAWIATEPHEILNSEEEVLILASIVEKEAILIKEMPLIASVYLNRLKIGMRLQADPTVIYGVSGGKGKIHRALTRKDLKHPGKYNTYLNAGLPPTPICNPGIKAIESVLNPADTDYLFFVSNANGGHWFAKTYSEHMKNVAKYKRVKKRKGNKKKRITR